MTPKLNKEIRAEQFKRYIERDSEKCLINGQEYLCRLGQPTERRQALLSGYLSQTVDLEAMVYIPQDENPPKGREKFVRSETGENYVILPDVRYDFGKGCYYLNLTRVK